jgi:putative ABC transport system permease protein
VYDSATNRQLGIRKLAGIGRRLCNRPALYGFEWGNDVTLSWKNSISVVLERISKYRRWDRRPVLADLREALRQLRKAPGVTTTAVVTLALGIGATTAIFTLVHQVMLKSLPVTKPEELWRIGDKVRCCNWGGYTQGDDGDFSLFSWEAYQNFRAQTLEFVDLAALPAGNAPLGVRRAGSRASADTRNGQYVSGNFFRTFGVQPWIGRLMTDRDDVDGGPPVAVLSYRIWNEKYAADASVGGATYQINGHPFTVIGVAAPGFYGTKLAGWGYARFVAAADGGTTESTVKRPA